MFVEVRLCDVGFFGSWYWVVVVFDMMNDLIVLILIILLVCIKFFDIE